MSTYVGNIRRGDIMKYDKVNLTDRCIKDLTEATEEYMLKHKCNSNVANTALFKTLSELNSDPKSSTIKLTFRCPLDINDMLENYMLKHQCNISTALRNILYWVRDVGGFDIM